VETIDGAAPTSTINSAADLDALCQEFKFTEFGKMISDCLTLRGPDHANVVITELRAAIAEQKLEHERDIYRFERQLAALGGGGDRLRRDV
jgi:hypothetical protein